MFMNPYIYFDGNCEEAFKFYEKCTGGKIEAMMTQKDAPPDPNASPEWRDKILHARLNIDGQLLMASDAPPKYYAKPQGFSITLRVDKPADADRIFEALSAGGKVSTPIAETFYAFRFAMFADKYGVPWMVLCEKPMNP